MTQSISNNSICLVSGGQYSKDSLDRVASRTNHNCYAMEHGYNYLCINKSYSNLQKPYFFKIAAVKEILPSYEWVVWLDNDTFFTDFSSSCFSELIATAEDNWLIIADSPKLANRKSPIVNSGVFLIKNTQKAFAFLDEILLTPLEQIKLYYDESKYGFWTNGDQDSIIYSCDKNNWEGVKIIDHNLMNSRKYEYTNSIEDHFILHLPGEKNKLLTLNSFARKFDCALSLIPKNITTIADSDFIPRLTCVQIFQIMWNRLMKKLL
ncbi:MAG: hypothetical protein LBR81_03680 [Prevotellaceae bacterium]|jgi:hypothetical protein|nr:hypothetical protein [Prevotellaceae bacterium]